LNYGNKQIADEDDGSNIMPATRQWQIQDAKNKLSEVVRLASQQPQVITVHNKKTAVVISYDQFRELSSPKQSLLDVMLAAPEDISTLVPPRSGDASLRDLSL
jgi:prevent-host-death family protein